jgi:hypothetical protein
MTVFFTEVINSAYYGYPELWIIRYPAHRYHAVPSPGFEPTTLWLRVLHPNHAATTLHWFPGTLVYGVNVEGTDIIKY